jgi:hypothetical protein
MLFLPAPPSSACGLNVTFVQHLGCSLRPPPTRFKASSADVTYPHFGDRLIKGTAKIVGL